MSAMAQVPLTVQLTDRARAAVARLKDVTPEFPFTIGWASSYEEVFSEQFNAPVSADEILDVSRSQRRILLTGRGGGGKTVILTRLARKAFESGILPVVIDLVNWTGKDNEVWQSCRDSDEDIVHFLLRRFAAPRISTVELNVVSAVVRSVLVIDGLSEAEARIGESILKAVDDFLIALPGTAVVVADRLTRRKVRLDRWRIAALRPLSEEAVLSVLRHIPAAMERYERAGAELRELLRSAYYLHRFIETPEQLAANKAAEQRRWFLVHASLSDTELAVAAAAAFEYYHRSHSRTFPIAAFESATSPDSVGKLRGSGALVVDEAQGLAYFDHQLKHDFLAARHLALNPGKWERDAFDVVTLYANSFDVLGLVLEQIENGGDHFVRRVYDWNPYGAAHVVAEDRERRLDKVSAPMRLVIQAVMAERRFHLMLATVEQAEDALRIIHSEESEELLDARSLTTVTEFVNRCSFDDTLWFREWQRVFTRRSAEQPTEADLATIQQEDSIIGWTYANVIKRLDVSSGQQATLRAWLAGGSPEVRWRIVHALGAFPSRDNGDLLFDVLSRGDDAWRWVRYGAARSLVEMAARDSAGELRKSIMETFAARSPVLLKDPQTLGEFARSVIIVPRDAPKDWADQVKTVVVELYKASLSSEAKQRWLRLTDEIDAKYTEERKV